MADVFLARRLQEYARHCFDLSSSAIRDRGPKTCLSASMLAQAAHSTLLGMIAFATPIEDDIDGPPQSLLHLARQIAYAEIHAFEEWELEMLAYLDIIHTKPVSRVLLPEPLPQGIYSNVYMFVDRLIGALHGRIKQKGEVP